MTDTNTKVREHYNSLGLTDRIKAALATITPESQALTVTQLAPLTSSLPEAFWPWARWLRPPAASIHPPACGSWLRHRRAGPLPGGHLRMYHRQWGVIEFSPTGDTDAGRKQVLTCAKNCAK